MHAARMGPASIIIAIVAGLIGVAFLDDQLHGAEVLARTVTQPDRGSSDRELGRPDPHHPTPSAATASVTPTPPADDVTTGIASRIPQIDSFQPVGDSVPANTVIQVTFTQPMARASVERAFVIKPGAGGRLTWLDDYTLRFEVYRLAHSDTYQVEVDGRSIRGSRLRGSKSFRFTTVAAPPDVIQQGPSTIKVPILMYHYIRVNPDRNDLLGHALSVTPSDFAAQMDRLALSGYHPITTEDLYSYLSGSRGLPSKPVVISFDDGYADFYTAALPVLRSHEFKAVAYVVSGFVGRPGYMTAEEVVEADRSGVEIGSHTVDHTNLARSSAGNVRFEVTQSKLALENLVGHPVVSFCYPSGKTTDSVAGEVQAAGYHNATTTLSGSAHTLADRYMWTRVRVSGGVDLDTFATAVHGGA